MRRARAHRLGGAAPARDDVRLGADPGEFKPLGSHAFALRLLQEAGVSVSPGAGFGPGGDGYVRFALVENEQRIGQAVRGIRRVLEDAGVSAAVGQAASTRSL